MIHKYRAILDGNLLDSPFIILDLETTGGNPEKNKILEICGLLVQNGEVKDRFHSFINPRMEIPPFIRKMTGITYKHVRHAPFTEEVIPKFMEFIGDHILVSHNTLCDLKFIDYYSLQTTGKPASNFFLCTHLLGSKVFRDSPEKSLVGLARYLEIPVVDEHRAESDAVLTKELFSHILKELQKQSISTIEKAIRFQGDLHSGLRLGWTMTVEDTDQIESASGVLYLHDEHDKLIYVFSSENMKRSLHKLKKIITLPKELQRIILNTRKITSHVCENLPLALFKEAEEFPASKMSFPPYKWHQKFVSGFLVRQEGDQFTLEIGPLKPSTLLFFGPVKDYNQAAEEIVLLQKVLNIPGNKRKLVFSQEYLALIKSYFELPSHKKIIALLKFSPSHSSRLKFIKNVLAYYRRLKEVPVLTSLLDLNGIMVLPSHKAGAVRVIPVHFGVPGKIQEVSEDWKTWLKDSKEGKAILEMLQNPERSPLTVKATLLSNALLWMLGHTSDYAEKKAQFFSTEDLKLS